MNDNIFYIFFLGIVIASAIIVYVRSKKSKAIDIEDKTKMEDKETDPLNSPESDLALQLAMIEELKGDIDMSDKDLEGFIEYLKKESKTTNKNISDDNGDTDEADNLSLTEDQNHWIGLVDMRVNSMPLELIESMGNTTDSLGNDHFLEYKANEPNVPKNKRKEVALDRVNGLLSIKDYVKNKGTKAQKFHFDSSLKGAELYASSLGLDI